MDPLIVLAYISIVLMLGILCSVVAQVLKLPKSLVLILLGLVLGQISHEGVPLISFDPGFILSIATLAFIMVVFDSTSRLKVREQSEHPKTVLKFIRYFMLFSLLGLTLFTTAVFFDHISYSNLFMALIFSVLVIETDIGSVFHVIKEFGKERAGRILNFLETEADLNSAFIVLFPFIIFRLVSEIDLSVGTFFSLLADRLPYFLSYLLVAIGVGLVIGIVLLKAIRNRYSAQFTPIAILSACMLAYLLARYLKGEGAIAVATMGFLFGNMYIKGKEQLEEFSAMLSNSLEIIIFVMLGMVISIPVHDWFILKSLLLFIIFVAIRMLVTFATLRDDHFNREEKVFIGLNMPKGMDLAVVALMLTTYSFTGLNIILPLLVAFICYSLTLTYFADLYHHKLLSLKREAHPVVTVIATNKAAKARPKRTRKKGKKAKRKK